MAPSDKPWIETPCLYSAVISRIAGCNVFLKMEFLQPSGSFKSRGIGNYIVRAAARAKAENPEAPVDVHFFCSSGGNAGLACATAARDIGLPATIVVPDTTSAYMVGKLRTAGATVHQSGANWAAADRYLREEVIPAATTATKTTAVYVPPFDHPDIWAGASTMVDELAVQLPQGLQPDAIVCSVGGGGLLCGLMEGIEKAGWAKQTAVVAVETEGADSLAQSVAAGRLVTLSGITSIATSLGAVRVAEQAFAWTQRVPGAVVPVVVSDGDAVEGIVCLLEETRILVEPACSAAVAAVVVPRDGASNSLRLRLGADLSDDEWAKKNVVLVVCGGSNINLDILAGYREKFKR